LFPEKEAASWLFLFGDGEAAGCREPFEEGGFVEFSEKARIRIEHWLKHNEGHLKDYREFAEELEAAGNSTGAGHIREMMLWTIESNQSLNAALDALD
jgi:hypothetical protein